MKFKMEYLSVQYFAYMRRTGTYGKENYILMEKFKEWAKNNNYFNSKTIIYGIARDNTQTMAPENCRYDVGMVVDKSFNHQEVSIDMIAKGKYLIFEIEHTAEAVQSFWSSFFTILSKEDYQFDKARLVLEKYRQELIEQGLCEFCIPVK